MRAKPGNDIDLGILPGSNERLLFSRENRGKHLHICGGTGVGKSKLLESLLRQDIKNWHKSKCGLILLDPHGKLFDDTMNWLAWNKETIKAPIIPIDLRQDDWIVAYNVLRQRPNVDPAVLTDNIVSLMAHVWGADGVSQTPLFARWAGNIVRTLYERNLTLMEAPHLMNHLGKELRHALTADLTSDASRQDWAFSFTLNRKDWESQFGSSANRFRPFHETKALAAMFGQPGESLDLSKALNDGSIILVSLATKDSKISDENARLFGTMLLDELWHAAKDRGKEDDIKPFYCYVDEFQKFLTPTIAENLDQARGFGLHFTLAHQFPNQLRNSGDVGRRIYDSVMENASSKVVFRLNNVENLQSLADWLFMGVMNPDEIKHELKTTKVMGYRENVKEVLSESFTHGTSFGTQHGIAGGAGMGGTEGYLDGQPTFQTSESHSEFASYSESESQSVMNAHTKGRSLIPSRDAILGQEVTSLQFRSLEEQKHRAMAVLFDQKERHGVARIVGTSVPVMITTPDINRPPTTPARKQKYLQSCYKKLPYAIKGTDAAKAVEDRKKNFAIELLGQKADEPRMIKRRAT